MASISDSTKLPQKWILWYHDPNNNDYSLESYIKIQEIQTLADFWNIVETISLEAWNSGMFFFMKDGYRPLWDAPENEKGGAWSKKTDASETHTIFVDCMVHCIAGCLLTKQNETIVGVTISPKGPFHIIKFWNTSTSVCDWKLFNTSLKMKVANDIAYRPHNNRPR